MMGELALRYPRNTLVVSTGAYENSTASDPRFPQAIDRVGIRATRLRTVQGLARWTWRAGGLAKQWRPGFAWCGELKPAGYPARWIAARQHVPYGSIIGNAAVIVAISNWTANLALDVVTALDVVVPVETVPLGTTPSHFRPGLDTSAVRAKYGLNGGPWLLTVARLEWHKGIDTVMRAMAAVRAGHPTARYAIAGTGERRAKFEQLRDELRLGDAVRFLGAVPDAELPALYNAADLYVGASRRVEGLAEGFGISLVEASACGLAVVGGRSGGVPDAVRDGETGILVDPDDPAAVAAGINALLADPARRDRLGAAGRKAVEEFYNWDRVVRDLMEIDSRYRSTR